jgi:hypothetical protein
MFAYVYIFNKNETHELGRGPIYLARLNLAQ